MALRFLSGARSALGFQKEWLEPAKEGKTPDGWKDGPPHCTAFSGTVGKMLSDDPKDRPTADELVEQLTIILEQMHDDATVHGD